MSQTFLWLNKPYQHARSISGLTQESAATLLHVTPRTLRKYESGETTPPDDVVYNMCKTYAVPYLAYVHVKQLRISEFLPDFPEDEFMDRLCKACLTTF